MVGFAPWNWFAPSSKIFLLTLPRRFFFCESFMFFLSCVCYAFVRACLFVPCGHLQGKSWPLGSRLWRLTVSLSHSHWYPGSSVVLDCIDSWSLTFTYFDCIDSWSLHPCLILLTCLLFSLQPWVNQLRKDWCISLYVIFPCVLSAWSYGVSSKVWYSIKLIADLCPFFTSISRVYFSSLGT